MFAASARASAQPVRASPSCRVGARPPLPSQLNEQRVVVLAAGRPALLAMPGPNPSNDNSSTVVLFQVGIATPSLTF